MATFRELLEGFVDVFGSQTALGRAIGVSPSRLSRVIRGEHSLEVINCLRLAAVTGTSPSVLLRAAGKSDIADLVERLYGRSRPTAPPPLTASQREVLDLWDRIPSERLAPLLFTMKVYAAASADESAAPHGRGREGSPSPRGGTRGTTPATRRGRGRIAEAK